MSITAAHQLGLIVEYGVKSGPDQAWHWFPTAHLRDAATQKMLDASKHPERVERWSWPNGDEHVWVFAEDGHVGFHDEPHFTRVVARNNETEQHSEKYNTRATARAAALRYFKRQANAANARLG